jgi:hypothetical protein
MTPSICHSNQVAAGANGKEVKTVRHEPYLVAEDTRERTPWQVTFFLVMAGVFIVEITVLALVVAL